MSAPTANDLTAHPRINQVRNPALRNACIPVPGRTSFNLRKMGWSFVLQHIRETQRCAVSGFKKITGSSTLQVFPELRRYGRINGHRAGSVLITRVALRGIFFSLENRTANGNRLLGRTIGLAHSPTVSGTACRTCPVGNTALLVLF